MKNRFFLKIKNHFSLLTILLLALILRLVNLNQSFWLDEAAQVIESARSLSKQLEIVSDFSPPLFHILLHFWIKLGTTESIVRLLSVFLGIGSIILIYKLAVFFGKKQEALLTSLFLTISPYHIWYSQEARPYMLFVFTGLFSTFALVTENWPFYIISTVFCLYSFYFAPFLIVGQWAYVFLFAKKHFKKFLLSGLISFIFFLPWIPFFVQQLSVGTGGGFEGWTKVVSVGWIKAVPLTFAKFIIGKTSIENNLIYSLVLLPTFLIFTASSFRLLEKKQGKRVLVLFWVPLFISVIASWFIPVLAPQRLIFLLPVFFLILAKGVDSFPNILKLVSVMVILSTSMFGVFDYYFNPAVQRENWREAINYIEKFGTKDSIALFVFPEPFAPYYVYKKDKIEAIGVANTFTVEERDLNLIKNRLKGKNSVFLFQYLTDLTDPSGKIKDDIIGLGFREDITKDFPGVGFVYRYKK